MKLIRIALHAAVCLLTAAAWTASASAENAAGWQTDSFGKRYYYDETGEPLTGEQTIDGVTYLFAPNGAQQVGWQTVDEKRFYYEPETGEPVFGWLHWRGEEYYISPENGKETAAFSSEAGRHYADEYGVLLHDTWFSLSDGWHYADEKGVLLTGFAAANGVPCVFDENGVLQTGWQTASDFYTRYYEIEMQDGIPALKFGWLTLDGAVYYNDAVYGKCCGIAELDGIDYCFDADGILQTDGWCSDGTYTYYAQPDGSLYKGLMQMQSDLYYFDVYEHGRMTVGLTAVDGTVYYFCEDGKAARGLLTIDGCEYYFDESCVMQTGCVILGNVPMFFDTCGRRCDGFRQTDDGTIYIDAYTGERAVGWRQICEDTYYFNADGIMAVSDTVIDGINYHFLENGVYRPVKICLDAGHYAQYNHSPVNPDYWESDFNWTMHLYLKEELEKYGIEVITTREDKDTDLPLEDRGRKSEGCDLFLSIHSNASSDPSDDGPLACCTVTGTCDQLGLDLANLVANVMGTEQGGSIWKRYSEEWEGLNYYGVLRGATFVDTPAILLEHSYHTNLRATNWLLEDENIRLLAKAEAAFLAAYFGMIPPDATVADAPPLA